MLTPKDTKLGKPRQGKLRIIGGLAKGRILKVPKGSRVRPTPDRVREALFSIIGTRLDGACVADVFAGTGAFGLEALSRGAQKVYFVEKDKKVAEILKANCTTLDLEGAEIFIGEAHKMLSQFSGEVTGFDIVFLDPPYGKNLEYQVVKVILDRGLLAENGICIVEHERSKCPPIPDLYRFDSRHYGNVSLDFYEKK